jgi:hypothetical protein
LDTKDEGIYVPDVALGLIDKMIEHCESEGYTTRKLYIIIQEINRTEMMMKDILQYFHYFIRPDFRQKPDIEIATEQYKEIADKRTLMELRDIVGKNNIVDFDSLGSSRIEVAYNSPQQQEITGYDPEVDGEIKEGEDIESRDS